MPNRIIKESVCTSDNLDSLTWFEEVCFYRIIVHCDDYGRLDARPAILRARLFPLKSVTDKQIQSAIQSLRSADIIDLYEVDGRSYLQMRKWDKHQSVRAKKSKYPAPEEGFMQLQANEINCKQLHANVPVIQSNPIQSESECESTHARAKKKYGEFKNVLLTEDELKKLRTEYQNADEAIEFLSEYIERKGYKAKSHYLTLKKWVFKALAERSEMKPENGLKSFDTDDFFEAALKKSYK